MDKKWTKNRQKWTNIDVKFTKIDKNDQNGYKWTKK